MRNSTRFWKISTFVLGGALAGVVAFSTIRSADAEPQPAMKTALAQLRAAKSNLVRATAHKGGHRAKAIALTEQAIDETVKGIAYENNHHHH